jgi:hypothetical protein
MSDGQFVVDLDFDLSLRSNKKWFSIEGRQ